MALQSANHGNDEQRSICWLGGESNLGFIITRTTANWGSVEDDFTMTYDSNLSNNGYARIINGL
ncbi:hypothetical protein [Spirosoma foliorum]|uniref:Uncharacterized protein n=1 Tax=Spirosoma foliorum TaxID=2710596 RepID=A0A7G5H1V5_9BACT|nr:hypothetical protein [Spirosoma foliorum]QMW05097.1 hypothetical protein H3H32_09520 [Spirosoma foliorum]